jgi:hypothetical protein
MATEIPLQLLQAHLMLPIKQHFKTIFKTALVLTRFFFEIFSKISFSK